MKPKLRRTVALFVLLPLTVSLSGCATVLYNAYGEKQIEPEILAATIAFDIVTLPAQVVIIGGALIASEIDHATHTPHVVTTTPTENSANTASTSEALETSERPKAKCPKEQEAQEKFWAIHSKDKGP